MWLLLFAVLIDVYEVHLHFRLSMRFPDCVAVFLNSMCKPGFKVSVTLAIFCSCYFEKDIFAYACGIQI